VRVAADDRSEWLGEHQSKELLRQAGLSVVKGRLVASEDDAADAVNELGGSIALKVSAPAVLHKSELGALELRIETVDRARLAYRRLAALAEPLNGDVLAEQMAPPGVELLIAALRGSVVPALVVGLGGTATEMLDSVAIIPLPADPARVERALGAAGFAPLLTGLRGGPGVDLTAAARLAAQTGELLFDQEVMEAELNPVLVSADGAIAVDAMVRVRR
jgi:succinyl-CoA synthetase beta subunit